MLSTLDLTAGFHQIELEESCRDITTFGCPSGKYRFKRLPFGLKNASSIFQQTVDKVLRGQSGADCYIDDILIYSETWEEHLVTLGKVLTRLEDAGLKVKRAKCKFGKRTLRYLGHIVGGGTVAVLKDRVKALKEWPKPTTKKQVKAFLGTVGYYRRFVPNFAQWTSALTPLTQREAPDRVLWTKASESAFIHVRECLCNAVYS